MPQLRASRAVSRPGTRQRPRARRRCRRDRVLKAGPRNCYT